MEWSLRRRQRSEGESDARHSPEATESPQRKPSSLSPIIQPENKFKLTVRGVTIDSEGR